MFASWIQRSGNALVWTAACGLALCLPMTATAGTIGVSAPSQIIAVSETADVEISIDLGSDQASIFQGDFTLLGLDTVVSAGVAIGAGWTGASGITSSIATVSLTSNPAGGVRALASFSITGLAPGLFEISFTPVILQGERFNPGLEIYDISIDAFSTPLATVTVTPEPSTGLLLGLGFFGLYVARRR